MNGQKQNGAKSRLSSLSPVRWLSQLRRGSQRTAETDGSYSLALQGGGVLGAFTWGVLHGLSERPGFRVEAITGASAGALNAAVFASGWARGGAQGARDALAAMWRDVAEAGSASELLLAPFNFGGDLHPLGNLFRNGVSLAVNAANFNPLRGLLNDHVDFDAIGGADAPRLYISATHVVTARPRIFTNADLTTDALLASACLPSIHPTVMIDGQPYWDGGFSSNPPLFPLYAHPTPNRVLVQLINAGAADTPRWESEIDLYLKRLMFSQPLAAEIDRLKDHPAYAPPRVIDAAQNGVSTLLTAHPTKSVIQTLFAQGEAAALAFTGSQPSGGEDVALGAPVAP